MFRNAAICVIIRAVAVSLLAYTCSSCLNMANGALLLLQHNQRSTVHLIQCQNLLIHVNMLFEPSWTCGFSFSCSPVFIPWISDFYNSYHRHTIRQETTMKHHNHPLASLCNTIKRNHYISFKRTLRIHQLTVQALSAFFCCTCNEISRTAELSTTSHMLGEPAGVRLRAPAPSYKSSMRRSKFVSPRARCVWLGDQVLCPPTPHLSGTFIELPPCGLSSCSFWVQQAAVINWSVMDSTAGKVRRNALLMRTPHLRPSELRQSIPLPEVWGCAGRTNEKFSSAQWKRGWCCCWVWGCSYLLVWY